MSEEGTESAGTEQGESGQDESDVMIGGSILTGGETARTGTADAGKQAEGKETEADESADLVPDTPEGYDLKFNEGTRVDQEMLGAFKKSALELGIKPSQAQKLAAMYEAESAKAVERAVAEHQQGVQAQLTEWEDEITSSPNFEQNRSHAQAALREFGDRKLAEFMNQTHLSSHPLVWAFMSRIGKALAEPGFKGKGAASGGQKSAADILYPNQGKQ